MDGTSISSLHGLTILDPKNARSKSLIYWGANLDNLAEEGWRFCYMDGTGRQDMVAARVHCSNRFQVDTQY